MEKERAFAKKRTRGFSESRSGRCLRRLAALAGMVLLFTGAAWLLPVSADAAGGEDPSIMAYNIYADPDLSGTGRKFDGFSIDFEAEKDPVNTYWALCNWHMDLTSFRKTHPDAEGMGCYGGLQNTESGRKALISFWEVLDGKGKSILRARRVYPSGSDGVFGGEGEGTNYMRPYSWKARTWYRMVLRSWKDEESGRTFVGQWFLDTSTGKWSEPVYFDTGLTDSFMAGDMSFFQENFYGSNRYEERSFRIRNIYVKELNKESWTSLPGSTLSHDTYDNKDGVWSFGADKEAFKGSAGGRVGDQKKFNAEHKESGKFTIEQPKEPEMPELWISRIEADKRSGWETLSWTTAAESAPLLRAEVTVRDAETSKIVSTVNVTRPEKRSVDLEKLPKGKYTATLTLTDIFGRTATRTHQLIVTPMGSAVFCAQPEEEEEEKLHPEDISIPNLCKLITDHYNRELAPEGEYVIFPENDAEIGDGTFSTVLRYQMSDAEAEEILAKGQFPDANIYASSIEVVRTTGKVTDEFTDRDGNPGVWYLQDEPGFRNLARSDGALAKKNDKIELKTDGAIIRPEDFLVGGKKFGALTLREAKRIYGEKTFAPAYESARLRSGAQTYITVNTLENHPTMPVELIFSEDSDLVYSVFVSTKDLRSPKKEDTRVNQFRITDSLEDVILSLDLPEEFRDKILFDLGEHMDVQIRRPVKDESGDYVLVAANFTGNTDQKIMIIDDEVQADFYFRNGSLIRLQLYNLRDFY